MIACFNNVFIKQGHSLGPQLLKSEKQSFETLKIHKSTNANIMNTKILL